LLFWTAIVRCLVTPSIVSLATWFGPPGILANSTLTFTASLGSFKYVAIDQLTSDRYALFITRVMLSPGFT
jgi:hypothetical protein